jgi:hypothetical protein
VEPERELIRRIWPYSIPAAALAFAVGALVEDAAAGWSAVVAIAVVLANFVAYGWSMAWAATISPVIVYAVGLGGYIVRLGIVVVLIALLRELEWFSVVAFVAALVPATIALLVVEMKLLSGRMQSEMWAFGSGTDRRPVAR